MASIHRQPGRPNYFCAFYDPEGFRRFRSAGTENPRIARTLCLGIERAATLARHGKLSSEKALKLIRETCSAIEETHGHLAATRAHGVLKENLEQFVKIAGGELSTFTVRSWLNSWIQGRTDASKATLVEYRRILELFLTFLGTRADRPLTTLQPRQVEEFKEHLAKRVAPSSVNKAIKVLKACCNKAVVSRQLEFSPAQHVEPVQTEETTRRAFTAEELKQLLAAADTQWRTMILVGYYTGLRLRDCANLTWRQVDLLHARIDVTPQKTRQNGNGPRLEIPIAEPLAKHLADIAGDNPEAPLCPDFSGKKASWLSAQFYNVMVKAGLAEPRDHQGKGKGRGARREKSQVSFHSLRYCTASALRASGVSEAIAMDIVGHETEAVHRHYSGKVPLETKRQALSKLPDITQ